MSGKRNSGFVGKNLVRPKSLMSMLSVVVSLSVLSVACSRDEPNTASQGEPISLGQNGVISNISIETVDDCGVLLEKIQDKALDHVGPYGFESGLITAPDIVLNGAEVDAVDAEPAQPLPSPEPLEAPEVDFAGEGASEADAMAAPVAPAAAADPSANQDSAAPAPQNRATKQAQAATTVATSNRAAATQAKPNSDEVADESEAEFSETNNQEKDVDEPDIVKTDGKRLITIRGSKLHVIDVSAKTPKLTKTVHLPEEVSGGELFLSGDSALLMTNGWTDRPFGLETDLRPAAADQDSAVDSNDVNEDAVTEAADPEPSLFEGRGKPLVEPGSSALSIWPGTVTGRVMEIDLSTAEVGRVLEFEGNYVSAREVDGSIRIVLSASGSRFSFLYPSNDKAIEAATQANRNLVKESKVQDWLPTYRITDGDEVLSEGPLVDCDRVHLPKEFSGFGSLVVLTADLNDGLKLTDSLSVFTEADTVYASTDRLVVAAPKVDLNFSPQPLLDSDDSVEPEFTSPEDEPFRTMFHSFDISQKDQTTYSASGAVNGYILSQFSMSEYDGHFRVATTTANPFGPSPEDTESFVTVLKEVGEELVEVGQVGNIGKGEDIKSVRFFGDVGYVVTYRQIDPFFTIDLSEPTKPEVLGELKIPGFSSYLHPVGANHVIGVGPDGNATGRAFGTVVSLIDVSDLTDPQRVAKLSLVEGNARDASAYTPVSDDSKAFTFWEPTNTAVVPVQWANRSDAVAVEVDVDSGDLEELGRVNQALGQLCRPIPQPRREPAAEVRPSETISQATPRTVAPSEAVEGLNDALGRSDAAGLRVQEDPIPTETIRVRPRPTAPPETVPAPVEPLPLIDYCDAQQPAITRTVIVGEKLLTFSAEGVGVHDFNKLEDVTWIELQR